MKPGLILLLTTVFVIVLVIGSSFSGSSGINRLLRELVYIRSDPID